MKKQQVQMQQVIVNPNKTSALTKLLRTLSFVILFSSIYIVTNVFFI